jgi:hypothetical protein
MTWEEFKEHTLPLAVQLGAEWDAPTWKLYYRAVKNIPMALYVAAVTQAAETRSRMPSAAQLRDLAEAGRQALLTANAFVACEQCNGTGWDTVMVDGVSRVSRCQCWRAHQQKLADMGVSSKPLALPAGESSDLSRVGE